MTIGGIVVGAIIICVLVYTIASASGLLKFGSSKNNNSGNTTASDSKSEKDSEQQCKTGGSSGFNKQDTGRSTENIK